MSQSSYIAAVHEGGLVQTIIIEAWPPALPLPSFVVVDYDTEGADEDELTTFTIGAESYEAVCHGVEPTTYESLDAALSPKRLLTGPKDPDVGSPGPPALVIARDVYKRILELDRELEDPERATAWEYNNMYILAERGPMEIFKALGDRSAIGS